jgi:hypothetical protein
MFFFLICDLDSKIIFSWLSMMHSIRRTRNPCEGEMSEVTLGSLCCDVATMSGSRRERTGVLNYLCHALYRTRKPGSCPLRHPWTSLLLITKRIHILCLPVSRDSGQGENIISNASEECFQIKFRTPKHFPSRHSNPAPPQYDTRASPLCQTAMSID